MNEPEGTEGIPEEGAADTVPTNAPKTSAILAKVAELIKDSNDKVQDRVIDAMVEREIGVRVEALGKVIARRTELNREINKISKPDVEALDATGKVVSSSYSKARVDDLKKKKDELAKVEGAIERAFNSGDFGKLKELAK